MADVPFQIAKIVANVRAKFSPNYMSDGDVQGFNVNNRGDQAVANALPDITELARMGGSWQSVSTTVAPVAAIPTTTAHFTLWNGEEDGGKSYVIDEVGIVANVSAGAVIVLGLLMCVGKSRTAAQAGSILISSMSGKPNYTGKGNTIASGTIVNDGWYPVGQPIVCAGTANIALGIEKDLKGRVIIPPGMKFSLAGYCSAAGSMTCLSYIRWHEVQLGLG